jgi:hypothetical protein
MSTDTGDQRDSTHDASLIDWFLSLDPAARLAELESRLAFLNEARRRGITKPPEWTPPNSGA